MVPFSRMYNPPPPGALSRPIRDFRVALILVLGGGGGAVALPPARGVAGSFPVTLQGATTLASVALHFDTKGFRCAAFRVPQNP